MNYSIDFKDLKIARIRIRIRRGGRRGRSIGFMQVSEIPTFTNFIVLVLEFNARVTCFSTQLGYVSKQRRIGQSNRSDTLLPITIKSCLPK